MRLVTLLNVTALGLALGATPGAAHGGTPPEANHDPTAACMEMMHGAGFTEEGRKAMREFMQSDRAPGDGQHDGDGPSHG